MCKQPEGRSAHADGCFLRARDGPGQKSEMIQSFTDTTSGLAGIRQSAFVLYLRSSNGENVGVGDRE